MGVVFVGRFSCFFKFFATEKKREHTHKVNLFCVVVFFLFSIFLLLSIALISVFSLFPEEVNSLVVSES